MRAFLDAELAHYLQPEPGLGMTGGGTSKEFSRRLGELGWLGMALPREYGGGDRSAVERFVLVEELLRRGAPVEHHWTADRQSGPTIARFGSHEQKARFLPAICRGELSFCIGMSEPDSGSDLAAVRSRATKADGGWRLNGTKVWTSNAHRADWMICLCRTTEAENRHSGLSQLLVDLHAPGVAVHPITFIDGTADFNEVVFDDVFIPDELLLGTEGDGWAQNTSELSFERAGPERWLSPFLVVEHFLREHHDRLGEAATTFLGEVTARWFGLRQVSLAVARMIDEGRAPSVESAMGKDLGTRFEQELMGTLQTLVEWEPSLDDPTLFGRLFARALLAMPSWTIRGGTSEVLQSVVSRGIR